MHGIVIFQCSKSQVVSSSYMKITPEERQENKQCIQQIIHVYRFSKRMKCYRIDIDIFYCQMQY